MPERDQFGEHVPRGSAEWGKPAKDDGDGPRVPTPEDLKKLPRWAVVAFTARCARRVQPLFGYNWERAPTRHSEAVEQAITLAEIAASYPAHALNTLETAGGLISKASSYGMGSDLVYPTYVTPVGEAADAAYVVAAEAVMSGTNPSKNTYEYNSFTESAFGGALAAAKAVKNSPLRAAINSVIESMWRDYKLLREFAKGGDRAEAWTDDTPVPPELFGPLWPEGEPEGWPSDDRYDRADQAIEFRIAVPPMPDSPAARDALRVKIGAVLKAANAVHLAQGGSGLRIAKAQVESTTPARRKAGS